MSGKQFRSELVNGVAFELQEDSADRVYVSRDGKRLPGHVEQVSDGRFGVSFIARSFADMHSAVEHLAYWHEMKQRKKPLVLQSIRWPDGTVSKVVSASTDSPLQLTLWQIEIQAEEARAAMAKLPASEEVSLGKDRVYKAEVGLKVHRAIELMLKVLLGIRDEQRGWRLDSGNRTHNLAPLYKILEERKEVDPNRWTAWQPI